MKKHLPNIITCCNLLCGAVATFLATQGVFAIAFLFILAGAFFDFFDGMTARKLGVSGPLGIQLDSLADDITFGLAPAMMVFCYLRPIIGWWAGIALLMAAFAALRLGKFNIDERQHSSFIGMATPANAIFWGGICSMPYAFTAMPWVPWVLIGLTLICDYLMVSEVPFFSFKFQERSWKTNKFRYIYLIGCLVLIGFAVGEAIAYKRPVFVLFSGAGCIFWYVIINLILNQLCKKN